MLLQLLICGLRMMHILVLMVKPPSLYIGCFASIIKSNICHIMCRFSWLSIVGPGQNDSDPSPGPTMLTELRTVWINRSGQYPDVEEIDTARRSNNWRDPASKSMDFGAITVN